jgi:4-hydroxyphenylpyruvate dioxygenase-like putative hemolysin
MGVHPADTEDAELNGTHNISFYCDNIEETVKELKSRGVKFTDEIQNQGYGMVTHFLMPGDIEVQLYEPLYKKD